MDNLAPKISSKGKDSSQQARVPAPLACNIETHHEADVKKLAHAPPVYLASDQATRSRLGDNANLNPINDEDAKKLAHAPPVHLETDQATRPQLGDNADLNPINDEDAKKLAHAPPVHLESDKATRPQLGDNADLNPISHGETQNLAHTPPVHLESNQAIPGAFRLGGPENDDSNTITYGDEVRSQASTLAYQVSARLVEEDEYHRRDPIPEVEVAVAVAVSGRDDVAVSRRKRFMYISVAVLVIVVVVATVVGVSLSNRTPSDPTRSVPVTSVPLDDICQEELQALNICQISTSDTCRACVPNLPAIGSTFECQDLGILCKPSCCSECDLEGESAGNCLIRETGVCGDITCHLDGTLSSGAVTNTVGVLTMLSIVSLYYMA
jgi:hypothetical protein